MPKPITPAAVIVIAPSVLTADPMKTPTAIGIETSHQRRLAAKPIRNDTAMVSIDRGFYFSGRALLVGAALHRDALLCALQKPDKLRELPDMIGSQPA
jgi:hypothetical protein